MAKRTKKARQNEFAFPEHGGAREGAGRKRSSPRPTVPHVAREEFHPRFPIHVTLRVHEGLPGLREGIAHRVLLKALIAGANRGDFRILEYSAQSNHVHLFCEADGRSALSRGIQALKRRIAHALNSLWGRSGALFAERYHDRVLKSPTEVRRALEYILRNSNHHGTVLVGALVPRRAPVAVPAGADVAGFGRLEALWMDRGGLKAPAVLLTPAVEVRASASGSTDSSKTRQVNATRRRFHSEPLAELRALRAMNRPKQADETFSADSSFIASAAASRQALSPFAPSSPPTET